MNDVPEIVKEIDLISPLRICTCRNRRKCLYLYHQLLESAFDREINPHVKAIKQYINKHLFETITLDMISSDVHLVDRYLCTLFKKHTGMTVIEYINAERIDAAKKLIATNDIPLYKVAEECGFTDYNNFARIFKKHTSEMPSKYRIRSRT